MFSRALAWLVAWWWNKKGDKVAADIASVIVIKGIPIQVADVKAVALAIAQIYQGRAAGLTAAQIEASVAPTLLGVAENVAALAFPGFGGPAVAMIAFLYEHSIPLSSMTQEQQNEIMDRQGMGPT